MSSERKINSGKWVAINIKAKENQNAKHYIDALDRVKENDFEYPLGKNTYLRILSVERSTSLSSNGFCLFLTIRIIRYKKIDSLFNLEKKENIDLTDWDNNVVTDKADIEFYFIPEIHKIAFKTSAPISPRNIEAYLTKVLEIAEPDGFDVDIIKDASIIERILKAKEIYSLKAKISFSNPDNTEGFRAVFDNKVREMRPDTFEVDIKGTKDKPLRATEDGFIEAVADISRENGTIKSTILEENGQKTTIDTAEHPAMFDMPKFESVKGFIYEFIQCLTLKRK